MARLYAIRPADHHRGDDTPPLAACRGIAWGLVFSALLWVLLLAGGLGLWQVVAAWRGTP